MTDCKPVGTPMLSGLKLTKEDSPKTPEECREMENIPYINAVGSLMYLATMTRPDIAYTIYPKFVQIPVDSREFWSIPADSGRFQWNLWKNKKYCKFGHVTVSSHVHR